MKINLTKLASRSKTIILTTVNGVLQFTGYNVVNSKRLIDFFFMNMAAMNITETFRYSTTRES